MTEASEYSQEALDTYSSIVELFDRDPVALIDLKQALEAGAPSYEGYLPTLKHYKLLQEDGRTPTDMTADILDYCLYEGPQGWGLEPLPPVVQVYVAGGDGPVGGTEP